jgi:DNA-binding NtrC family response regulator
MVARSTFVPLAPSVHEAPSVSFIVSSPHGVFVIPSGDRTSVVLGRSPSCDVVLDDPSAADEHARITLGDDGAIAVEDLGGGSPTRVSGQELVPGRLARVDEESVIAIGASKILVRRAPRASSAPAARDPEIERLHERMAKVAPTTLPVLLVGETGSGKELAAESIHRQSHRASKRFVKVNCAALTESLLESELFGHEKGAFTGAHAAREGLFAAADGGTLFLDEVGELSLRAQAKLLRVLEVGEIMRVGSTTTQKVDVRVVSATHRDLPRLVAEGQFREDLYFRLKGATLRIPPLRKRPTEIVPLAKLFIAQSAEKLGRPVPMLSGRAARMLVEHRWPGNVRELRCVIDCAMVMCQGPLLDAEHIDLGDAPPPSSSLSVHVAHASQPAPRSEKGVRDELRSFERARILAVLAEAGGNQTKAAKILRVSRRTLTNKLNAHGIERPRKRTSDAPQSSV